MNPRLCTNARLWACGLLRCPFLPQWAGFPLSPLSSRPLPALAVHNRLRLLPCKNFVWRRQLLAGRVVFHIGSRCVDTSLSLFPAEASEVAPHEVMEAAEASVPSNDKQQLP